MSREPSKSFSDNAIFASGLLVIVAATALAYCRVPAFEFLNWDDNVYVVRRPEIRDGLTLSGFRWACTTFEAANWHPLVWISYMGEIQLFGPDSGAMHVSNLGLHLANSILVALVIRRLTVNLWAGLAVAALFGLHPQHVEAVAWVSERKELLCAFFGLLTLLAWQAWRANRRRSLWIAAHLLFALSLLSKQMLVTLPFLMLVLENCRLKSPGVIVPTLRGIARAAWEKAGLFLLAFSAIAAAFTAQHSGGAIADSVELPYWVRAANAVNSIVMYLVQTLVPWNLSPFYRHPQTDVSIVSALLSLLAIAALTAAVWKHRDRPGMLAGWLWFPGTLVPVLGLVQLGAAARADRYTYFPHIGLFLMLSAIPVLQSPRWRSTGFAALSVYIVCCCGLTFRQSMVWKDSISLWKSVLRHDPDSYRGHEHLATAFLEAGQIADALKEAELALQYPENRRAGQSFLTLGTALLKSGDTVGAIGYLREAAALSPTDAIAWLNLGCALRESDPVQSKVLFEKARHLAPANVECIANLANSEARDGKLLRAEELYREALRISPTDRRLKENLMIIQEAQSLNTQQL